MEHFSKCFPNKIFCSLCFERVDSNAMWKHARFLCIWRPMKCPLCKNECPLLQLDNHVQNCNFNLCVQCTEQSIPQSESDDHEGHNNTEKELTANGIQTEDEVINEILAPEFEVLNDRMRSISSYIGLINVKLNSFEDERKRLETLSETLMIRCKKMEDVALQQKQMVFDVNYEYRKTQADLVNKLRLNIRNITFDMRRMENGLSKDANFKILNQIKNLEGMAKDQQTLLFEMQNETKKIQSDSMNTVFEKIKLKLPSFASKEENILRDSLETVEQPLEKAQELKLSNHKQVEPSKLPSDNVNTFQGNDNPVKIADESDKNAHIDDPLHASSIAVENESQVYFTHDSPNNDNDSCND